MTWQAPADGASPIIGYTAVASPGGRELHGRYRVPNRLARRDLRIARRTDGGEETHTRPRSVRLVLDGAAPRAKSHSFPSETRVGGSAQGLFCTALGFPGATLSVALSSPAASIQFLRKRLGARYEGLG